MFELNHTAIGAATKDRACARAVSAVLPNIPLLALSDGEIALKRSRDVFRHRKVVVIGEFDPCAPGTDVVQLMHDYAAIHGMMQLTEGVDEAICLSRANPVALASGVASLGVPFPAFTLLTDPAGCFAAFLEAEGCLPVRTCISNASAFAVIVEHDHIEHLYIRRDDPSCATGREGHCANCPHFST